MCDCCCRYDCVPGWTDFRKTKNKFDAAKYLTRLSGTHHFVYTGIAIAYKIKFMLILLNLMLNFMNFLHEKLKNILNKEPFDKAGAYGIQGYGSQFIKRFPVVI